MIPGWARGIAAALLLATPAAHAESDAPVDGEFSFHSLQGWDFEEGKVIPEVRRAKDADLWFEAGSSESPTLAAAGGIASLAECVELDDLVPGPEHLRRAILAVDPAAVRLGARCGADERRPETDTFVLRTRRGGWVRLAIVGRGRTKLGWQTWPVTIRYTHSPNKPRFALTRRGSRWMNGLELAPAALPRRVSDFTREGRGASAPLDTDGTVRLGAPATSRTVLDEAKVLARHGDRAAAASRFGEAAALAHQASDPVAENAVGDAFAEFVSRETTIDTWPNDDGSRTRPARLRAVLLAAAMKPLDPARCGAFLSAPALARSVLYAATETGDFAQVPAAAKVAALHGRRPGSGRASVATALYAEGVRLASEGKPADAVPTLEASYTDALGALWLDLAMHAGTELVLARWSAGDTAGALRELRIVGTSLSPPCPERLFDHWEYGMVTRLPDDAHPLRKALSGMRTTDRRYTKGESGYGSGRPGRVSGVGGAGGEAGDVVDPISPIGRLLPRLGSRPFVEVARKPKGLTVRWATSEGPPDDVAFEERPFHVAGGGVTLGLHSRSVWLAIVDPEGARGQPGDGLDPYEPDAARAVYLLAEGEVWSVAADGRVSIRER